MEARQFYNRSINTLITKSFACKWSEDNQLSVVTSNGVQIFEIKPGPMQNNPILNTSCTYIQTLDSPKEIYFANDVSKVISNFDKENVYSFIMNDVYTPNLPKVSRILPKIIDIFWSPQNLFHHCKCLIAILLSNGVIQLAALVNHNWKIIFNFTSSRIEVIDDNINQKSCIELLKQKIQYSFATTATWSNLYYEYSDTCYAYLVIAFRNSEIVVWKVNKIINDNLDYDVSYNIKLKEKLTNVNNKISTLLWVQSDNATCFLLIGFVSGQVGVLKIKKEQDEIVSNSFCLCYSDIDNIPVDNLYILKQEDECLEIIVIKGMYFIILAVNNVESIFKLKFSSSYGFSITGLSIINSNMIIITTQDANLFTINRSDSSKEFFSIPITLDILKNKIQYYGLSCSINKLLFAVVVSPSIMYDHLTDREPSSIYFFNLLNIPLLNPIDLMLSNKKQTLLKYWDCIELIKVNTIKDDIVPQVLSTFLSNIEFLSLYELRITYWILLIKETFSRNDSNSILEDVKKVKYYIFLHSTSNYLKYLVNKMNLTSLEKTCINLIKYQLDIWLAGEEYEEFETPLTKHIKEILEMTNKLDISMQEKCNLCGDNIMEPWISSCSNGHKLIRCALSCLQIEGTKYGSCNVCKTIFHSSLVDADKEVMCLYCDLPVIYKIQIMGLKVLHSRTY